MTSTVLTMMSLQLSNWSALVKIHRGLKFRKNTLDRVSLSKIFLKEMQMQVKQVDGATLTLICNYLKHHKVKEPAEIAKPIRSVKMEKIVEDTWDARFVNELPKRSLFQLILGANY